jgi:hypothetical protein
MSNEVKGTGRSLSARTTFPLNPQRGSSAFPFINSTTSPPSMMPLMRPNSCSFVLEGAGGGAEAAAAAGAAGGGEGLGAA